MKLSSICIIILSFISFACFSQARIDTSQVSTENYIKKKRNIFKGEPGKAALYSLIIPGGGQVYNKDYWKVPLVYAAEGTALYFLIENNKLYSRWNTCYESIVENHIDKESCGTVTSESTAFNIRKEYRGRRELSYVFVGIAHLLNIVEAYVDRHLTLFDISDDLTFFDVPKSTFVLEPQVTLVHFKIPLNKK